MKYLDSNLQYTEPTIESLPTDIQDLSWEEINVLANKAANNPTKYRSMIGLEKSFEISYTDTFSGPSIYDNATVTARIVDIAKERTPESKNVGFIFNIYKGMSSSGNYVMTKLSGSYPDGYPGTYMHYMITNRIHWPTDLSSVWQEFLLRYRPTYDQPATTITTNIGLLAASNVFWKDCGLYEFAFEFIPSDIYPHEDEGEPYQYYIDNNTSDARTSLDNAGGFWLLSPYSSDMYLCISGGGYPDCARATENRCPQIRFCLGASN